MTYHEREKMIYEKYPVTKAERDCADEKRIMDRLREKYRRELRARKEKQEFKK